MSERPPLLRRLFGNFFFLLNLLAALWLFLCLAAATTSPEEVPYLALFSITTPFALLLNIFFLVFWLFAVHKWRVFIPIITLAICHSLLLAVFGWYYTADNNMSAGPRHLKVMTWNVHGMGIFERPHKASIDDEIMELIRTENPDILCMPEFYTVYSNALKPYSTHILQQSGYREFRFKYDNTLGSKIYLGIAVFSKYPLRNFKFIPLHADTHEQGDVLLLQGDITLPGKRTLRTYFTHLQSFLLSDGEKSYIEEVKNRDKELPVAKSGNFIKRFEQAYIKRAVQADKAAAIIAESPYPALVCGDFNDLPGSYTYTRMKGKLTDAFVARGKGLGRTYNMFSPTLRIDYIFYDPQFLKIIGYHSPQTKLSDHNPVIVNFELPQ